MNKRRRLVFAIGAVPLLASLSCFAQQSSGSMLRLGFLGAESQAGFEGRIDALRAGLRDLGYVEGKSLLINFRWAEGDYAKLPYLATELVQASVNVIVASTSVAARAAQKATSSIPIIMVNVSDPVAMGLVKSLARPGGNLTGISNVTNELSAKHLEMIHSMVPKVPRIAALSNPSNLAPAAFVKNVQASAQKMGVKIYLAGAINPKELAAAFGRIVREKAGAVVIQGDPFFNQQRYRIAELAAQYRLPLIGPNSEYAEAGILMSYGVNRAANFRRAATFVDKVFKGADPGNLPVEQPTKFELVINKKTANTLGLTIPQSLLISADKVIE